MPKQHGSGGRFGIGALGVAGILSAIGGTYKVAEFLVHMRKLHDVGEENAVFVRLLERVRLDLQETDRLLRIPEVQEVLEQNREKREYVLGVIDSTQRAVHDMAKFTERVDKDVKKKGGWFSLRRMTGMDVGLRNRIWWVLEEHERLLARRLEIATCHEGLVMVLGFLAKYEPLQGKGRGHRKNVVVVEDRHREHERVVERPEIRHETVYRKEYDDYERPPPTVVNVREERVHREHQEEEPRVVNVREERIYRDSYDGPHRPSREEPAEYVITDEEFYERERDRYQHYGPARPREPPVNYTVRREARSHFDEQDYDHIEYSEPWYRTPNARWRQSKL